MNLSTAKNVVAQHMLNAMAAANVPIEDALWYRNTATRKGILTDGDASRARSIFARVIDRSCMA